MIFSLSPIFIYTGYRVMDGKRGGVATGSKSWMYGMDEKIIFIFLFFLGQGTVYVEIFAVD